MEDTLQSNQPSYITNLPRRKIVLLISILVGLYFVKVLFIGSFFTFQEPRIIDIKHGTSLKSISQTLEDSGVVYSKTLLSISTKILRGESRVVSGAYSFKRKQGAFFVAKRLIEGRTDIKASKVTIPEGFTSAMIAERFKEEFNQFDVEKFLLLSNSKEGFLFPDTYFFLPTVSPEEVIERLENTFWQKTEEKFGWKRENEKDVYKNLTLASIVEEEVQSLEDKKIVAGIFLNRIKIGMPLQADSTLAYVTGRDSLSLTLDDLNMENAYNSYKNKGLPLTPISNPGLESIEAVLNPTKTAYLYFLTDKDGKVYYAKTFDEHKINKQKYLR